MNRTYISLAILLILVAFGLVLLPDSKPQKEIAPEDLFRKMTNPSRFLEIDQIADRIIKQDPSLLLVDVRPEDEYSSWSLPGALNIPLDRLLEQESLEQIDLVGYDVVFFSNGDVWADQAWMLATREGLKNLFIMKGGLNKWFDELMQPKMPEETASKEEFERYEFLVAARNYFLGGSVVSPTEEVTRETVQPVRRKKKTVTEGGC
ncbi:MAG: hypothetical protein Kow00127_04540 [Bacteroidales bacterium]